jgi:hypothetical protein
MGLFDRLEQIANIVSGCKLVYPPFSESQIKELKERTKIEHNHTAELLLSLNAGSVSLAEYFWEEAREQIREHVIWHDGRMTTAKMDESHFNVRLEVDVVRWGAWILERKMKAIQLEKKAQEPRQKSRRAAQKAAKKAAKGKGWRVR